jgi:hypothetical protein
MNRLKYYFKVIELEIEIKTYKSLCKKLMRKIQEQKDLIDILYQRIGRINGG